LVIPAELYSDNVLSEEPVDNTGTFIKECGHNHFFMDNFTEGRTFKISYPDGDDDDDSDDSNNKISNNDRFHSFLHSIGTCRMRRFLAVFRSFFHSPLLCTFSCHLSPPTIRPSSLTLSCHLFFGLPLSFVVPKFIYNTRLGILFSSILCTCPNQRNLFNFTVCIIVGYFNSCISFFIG